MRSESRNLEAITAAVGDEWADAATVRERMAETGPDWGSDLVSLWLEQAVRDDALEKLWGTDGDEYYRLPGFSR